MLPKKRKINLEIDLDLDNPELLQGLQNWLDLGLINDLKVKNISQKHLTCTLPETVSVKPPVTEESANLVKKSLPVAVNSVTETENVKDKKKNIFVNLWNRFYQEIAVRSFLFLGIFLVVTSSSILAATQWNNFPDWFQYFILFSYTLAFWITGFHTQKKENLALTSQTLQAISFLLIPINFWTIDSFVWTSGFLGGLISAIALFALSYIYFFSNKNKQKILIIINFLILSYLQIGWQVNNFPLLAIYGGVISLVLTILTSKNKQSTNYVLIAFIILLTRGIFIENIPLNELGLVIGICGWCLTQLSISHSNQTETTSETKFTASLLHYFGYIFLFFGWFISLINNLKWQALAINFLVLSFCYQQLIRYWRKRDLIVMFVVGLHSSILFDSFFPPLQLLNIPLANEYPSSLLGITTIPFLLTWIVFTGWLYKKNQPKLALLADKLNIFLLLMLTWISWFNPFSRIINLSYSTPTLIYLSFRSQNLRKPLTYLSHFYGLLTIVNLINYVFTYIIPTNLTAQQWAIIYLALTVIELCFSCRKANVTNKATIWYQSCWYFGLALATISYILFGHESEFMLNNQVSNNLNNLWLLTPITLTFVGSRNSGKRRLDSIHSSFIALILGQALSIFYPVTEIIGLGIATVLMVFNTYYIPSPLFAASNFVFGFFFLITLLSGKISFENWFIIWSCVIASLWLLPIVFQSTLNKLAQLYMKVAEYWAIFISGLELLIITSKYLSPQPFFQWQLMVASILIGLVMTIRYRQKPNYYVVLGISWTLEITLIEFCLAINASRLQLAIGNIILGFLALILINRLKNYPFYRFLSIAPLVYAIVAICLRIDSLTQYTGLITLGASIIGIGVSYFQSQRKFITYFSIAGITLSFYELIAYQVSLHSQFNIIDGCTTLALVSAFFAFFYRFFAWWLRFKNKSSSLNIPRSRILLIAHTHWGLAVLTHAFSIALSEFIFVQLQPKLNPVSLVISVFLAVYGVFQARDTQPEDNDSLAKDIWVYLGLIEFFSGVIHARLIFKQLAFLDSYSAIFLVIFCAIIYKLPWDNFGWNVKPWRHISTISPALIIFVTWEDISIFNLIMVALFYIFVAIEKNNIRWSYFSCFLIDWAIARWLWENGIEDSFWFMSLIGLTFIYIAQFDPHLKSNPRDRHYFRLFGSGTICLFAVLLHQNAGGLLPISISLGFVLLALATQIRAFLYVGTISFCLTIFYQVTVLLSTYSFLKWIIGLTSGIVLIIVAANFEQQKDNFKNIWQNYLAELKSWD